MKTRSEITERLNKYSGPELMYLDYGYIVWQTTTGENFEILFIEVKDTGKGDGKKLLKEWMDMLAKRNTVPFVSVSVTRLARNEIAGKFYRKMGFREHAIEGLYKEGAVMSTISFEQLWLNLL